MNYWLMKSEPDVYSFDDLERDGQTHWEGVRNYQARNFMREMKTGDKVFYYHSNAKEIGIIGVAEVIKEAYPDPFQFDETSKYYDPKATPEAPRWDCVDIRPVEKFKEILELAFLKDLPELENLPLVKRGNRLSVMPVSHAEYECIMNVVRNVVY